jgi:hypothetical protein
LHARAGQLSIDCSNATDRHVGRLLRVVMTMAIAVEATACYTADDITAALDCKPPDRVGSVRVQPTGITLPVGGTAQLTATLADPNGATFLLCPPPTFWVSANAAIARVSGGGVGIAGGGVLAGAAGTTYIAARAGGQPDSVKVTVTAAP